MAQPIEGSRKPTSKAAIGDPIPTVSDEVWERMSRREPTSGPRCYICNGLITGDWRRRLWMCVGPGEDRRVIEAYDPTRETDVTQGGHDAVHVGRDCARRYVPKEALWRGGKPYKEKQS
jgi:hypothetical protein